MLESARFELRKWTSNSIELLDGLAREHLLNEDFLDMKDKSSAKTLDVRWNASSDCFFFSLWKKMFLHEETSFVDNCHDF